MKRLNLKMLSRLQIGGELDSLFSNMGIAEEEIARAGLSKEQGCIAFKHLCPSEPLRGKDSGLYRAHAKEIIRRVKADEDLRPATDAELLGVFSDTSLIAPFGRNATAAFEALWSRVMKVKIEGAPAQTESWSGAVVEVIEVARKKYAVSNRRADANG